MRAPSSAPDWVRMFTAEERPDLYKHVLAENTFGSVWPEYNNHGNHTSRYFSQLLPRFPALQFLFVDSRTDRIMARGRTIPFFWDGSLESLPSGIDAVGLAAIENERPPNTLSALAAEVIPDYQGQRLSRVVIEGMASVARAAGLSALVAPVRPNWKDRYPLIPIERYAQWCRADGLPFDPWLRVHARLGASILRAEPESLEISHPVTDWETWTGMEFPEDGEYVFPQGLAPLTVRDAMGRYWEPNVWMRHEV